MQEKLDQSCSRQTQFQSCVREAELWLPEPGKVVAAMGAAMEPHGKWYREVDVTEPRKEKQTTYVGCGFQQPPKVVR